MKDEPSKIMSAHLGFKNLVSLQVLLYLLIYLFYCYYPELKNKLLKRKNQFLSQNKGLIFIRNGTFIIKQN